ncbi:breast carcinoma-amplified sequence 1 isoform X9 [Echinops telfairi]|uniref:Breast carcinoma-amplified sequence 1 isoform X9 n=1 Tax=Echinops telfairi TaxID=9371 RepID=A0AC55DI24_ECHTE|nr:breast carcinoma-amplified sequence 1 isoform X9 [Echinops telfairi]
MLSYEVSVSRAGFDDSKFSELAGETVDLGIRVQADNAAASSPGTMEPSRVADAGGTGAKPEVPAARSRLFMTLSGPVPGRARDQASDSSAGSVRLNVSPKKGPGNKGPSESVPLPAAAAVPTAPDKTPAASGPRGPAPLPPEPEGAALSVPKDPGFFDKIFKLDKGREKTPVDSQADAPGVPRGDRADNVAGPAGPRSDDRGQQDVADSKEREGPEIASLDSSVLEGIPEAPETTAENPQATEPTESNHPIMSFFKTLVSPNKAEANKEPEDTGAEKSPPALADPKSDKANIVPQETQGAAKNPKGCSPVIPAPSAAASETAKDGPKERAGPTSLPLGKLFWKKSSKEDSIPTGSEENTSDSTEKTPSPPEPEPEPTAAAPRGREGPSKEKKAAAEPNKQKSNKPEAKDGATSAEPCVVEADPLQNGDQRAERPRPSLRGFLKGLGPKRMLDAQVQTDPVSIGPVGKSK